MQERQRRNSGQRGVREAQLALLVTVQRVQRQSSGLVDGAGEVIGNELGGQLLDYGCAPFTESVEPRSQCRGEHVLVQAIDEL